MGKLGDIYRALFKPQADQSAKITALRQQARMLKARYDAAQTTVHNQRHWANADGLSPAAAASPEVRRRLRSRARYECIENNSFAKGIILTLANDLIGRGPTPQVNVATGRKDANQHVERSFRSWCRSVGLARKLRSMATSTPVDGEVFGVKTTNMRQRHEVKLDVRVLEADYCSSPTIATNDPRHVDGVRLDDDGNPVEYYFTTQHPGDGRGGFDIRPRGFDVDDVIHYFREDRPDQARGIPWVTPALPLFADLRRYSVAVMGAAETAASPGGVMYSDAPALDPDEEVDPMDVIDFEHRAMLTLPAGWKLEQIKAEQPTTTFEMFRNAILNEIARCLNMPFNKAAGNSSGYNYSSGRLDHQTYFEAIDVARQDFELLVLDKIFAWWLEEAALIPGVLPDDMGPIALMSHTWRWPRFRHIDPLKQAQADIALWNAGLLSDEQYCYENDRDPEEHYASLGRQYANRRQHFLPLPGENPLQPATTRSDETEEEEEPAHAE